MICTRCGSEEADDRRFCGDCGSPLSPRCMVCGSENPPGKKFCRDCGASLGDSNAGVRPEAVTQERPSVVAERRQLTVMFADMVGSTPLSVRLDPEEFRDVIAAFHDCVSALVTRFGGTVARYMGDGELVFFGFPQAREDDAERAVHGALEIVEAVSRLATIAGPPGTLAARVGIATGLVIVGHLAISGSSLVSDVVGDTPNLAARLQGLAEPGAVVIAESTRRLIGGLFDYRELGPVSLKGLEGTVRAWVVLREGFVDSRFEALRPGRASLVGRAEEFDLLMRRWDQAKTGEGRVVLISGEPGIGKSHLVARLEQKVTEERHERARFLASPYHTDTPLYPIVCQLERSSRFERGDTPEAKFEKLRRMLARRALSATDIALIADLLSIPANEAIPPTMTPQRRREMTFAAVVRQFDALARDSPLLAVFEDLHWADPTTQDFLHLLIEAVQRARMLVVITTRPDVHPPWAARPHVTVQVLSGLGPQHAASLVMEAARGRDLPEQVIERIIAHADGIPLFIEELTATVIERGPGETNGYLPSGSTLSTEFVPTPLQALLMARLDRLAAGKGIAQVGSVIGREFSFEMLLALSGVSRKKLERALGELVMAGLLIAHGEAPSATYTFKHALVQDAAYASLLRDRRRTIHLRLAEMLESNPVDAAATEPDLLAWHFAQAGAPDRAIDHYLLAADKATGRSALAEIANHLRKALEQVECLSMRSDTRRRELTVQVALGRALIDHRGSGSEEVGAAFERARELCLTLSDTKELLRVHDGLFNHHFTHSEPEKLLLYADEISEIARRTGDPQAGLMARRSAGCANLLLGRFEDARAEMEALLASYDVQRGAAAHTTRDMKASACTILGICLTAMGYPESGKARSRAGVRHADDLGHVISLTLGLRRACVQGIMLRDLEQVTEFAGRLLAVNAEYETFLGTREGTIFYAWAQLQTRDDPEVFAQLRTSLDQLDKAKHRVMLPFFLAAAAEIKGEHGDEAEAKSLLQRASELIAATGEQWYEPEILRLRARFGAGDRDEALDLLRASLAKGREQKARLWELRSAIDLAGLLDERGERVAAKELLHPVVLWFTEGEQTRDLTAARSLLARLDGGSASA